MADKLSDKEIERRKQQAALKAAAPKPHENFRARQGAASPVPSRPRPGCSAIKGR